MALDEAMVKIYPEFLCDPRKLNTSEHTLIRIISVQPGSTTKTSCTNLHDVLSLYSFFSREIIYHSFADLELVLSMRKL